MRFNKINLRKFLFGLYGIILIMLLLSSCSLLSDDDIRASITDIYVSSSEGDDLNSGKLGFPLKTITKALEIAGTSSIIRVIPGTYDESNGEQFPLIIPSGMQLFPLDIDKPIIIGGGTYYVSDLSSNVNTAIVSIDNNFISGFDISNPNGAGLLIQGSKRSTIRSNKIQYSEYGIIVSSNAEAYIISNIIQNNTINGIQSYGSSKLTLRNNTIEQNLIGINLTGESEANLGDNESNGFNTIQNNIDCDCYNTTLNSVPALGNIWDADVSALIIESNCIDGNDLVSLFAPITYQFIPDSNQPLFNETTIINLIAPAAGVQILSQTPSFRWHPTNKPLVLVAAFSAPITIQKGKIYNVSDIVWLWHSGFNDTIEGNIQYHDGVSNYETNDLPLFLEQGRTYYWACWGWDDQGISITHSSPQYSFSIGF